MRFEPTTDPAEFQRRAGAFLSRDPLRHTVIISVLERALAGAGEQETTFVSVHDAGTVVGACMRTPGYNVWLGVLPAAALPGLAALFAARIPDLGGVEGTPELAEGFAREWAALRGTDFQRDAGMLLYRLGTLRMPRVPGIGRAAVASDVELCERWMVTMQAESGIGYAPEAVPGRIEAGLVWLWECDGRPVSLAGQQPPVDGWSRIGPVYTPAALRGHGYASGVTAHVSRQLRDSGCQVCLFTDTANPTSNKIYREIGYEPVREFARYLLA
ncbi:GNAT family N-acetyltransferase [Nocardia sp. alder85J]|uniref:GNAT family N-acetyltransferase n=1 Tax=Nocardia sp. alder85J TaxID=2862949 RepID=UPI001CD72DA1|nr:GNAT family N-acetyltransferase [Nocardia sp. alder85J]MCX4095958.1 GNAT family N-acetyltransferase [Nocardia sp. alder85J]